MPSDTDLWLIEVIHLCPRLLRVSLAISFLYFILA